MSKKRIILIVCGVVLAVLLIGVGSYYAYEKYYQPKKVEEENLDDTTEKIEDNDNEQKADTEQTSEEAIAYTLVGYSGEVFGAKMPQGWDILENESGIEISDPNDSNTGASGVVAVGWYGYQTPDGFIEYMLEAIGAESVSYENESDQEEITDPTTGLIWQMKSKTFTFSKNGKNLKAKISAGVLNGYGQFMGMLVGFQTTPDKWAIWAPTLERIAKSITIINTAKAGGINKVRLPSAADLKNDSSPLMESWEYRNNVNERSSHEWSDAIMGQETDLYSPSTGQEYTRPFSDYDPTIGGYRNPDNNSEILIDPYEQ